MSTHSGVIPAARVLLVLIAISALLLSPLGVRLEETFGLPLLFGIRGVQQPPAAVALIALDEESVVALNLPDLDQIDRWPRTVYAQLIRALQQNGAAVIAMDIAFLTAGDPRRDAELAAAMQASGNVTILKLLGRMSADRPASSNTYPASVQWQSEPLPLFRNSAAAVNVFTLPDHALKKYTRLYPRTPEGIEASMPVVALQLYQRNARTLLMNMLQQLHEHALIQRLASEQRPAFFAAEIRRELLARPALARAMELSLKTWPDKKATKNLHALLSAWQSGDPTFINFYGPQHTIPTFSLHLILSNPNSHEAKSLRGKVVFVGLSERYQKQRDYFFTVYPAEGGSRISGVEVAATLFANLLEERPLRTPMLWQSLLGLWLWGGLLIFAARRLRATHWLLLTLILGCVYGVIAIAAFNALAWWLPIVIPLLLTTPALALLAIWQYYRHSDDAERAATAALSLYIPAEVAESIAKNRQQLLAHHRQIDAICLLTDIVGFTSLSEMRDAGYMHDLINRYYGEIVADVERHGGVVANIVGDGLLALWPIDQLGEKNVSAQARCACACALDIVATSDRMTKYLGEPLTTCVGIHSGPVSLGHLGAGQHFEYAPVGDTINTTSRIEAYTRHLDCRILLSASLKPWLQGFTLRNHGEVALKGKHKLLTLYELLGTVTYTNTNTEKL